MDEIHATTPITLVIHGACTDRETKKLTGADRWAEEWAIEREVPYMGVPARWTKEGRSAGPRRNGRMAAIRNVDMVLAMPGDAWRAFFHVVAIRHQNVGVRRRPQPAAADSCAPRLR